MIDSKRTAGLVILSVALVGCAAWLAFGRSRVQAGEGQLDIPLICSACGHGVQVDYYGLMQIVGEAIQKGVKDPGGRGTAVGFCPKCSKPTLFRAEEDPQTGKPVLPSNARSAGQGQAGTAIPR